MRKITRMAQAGPKMIFHTALKFIENLYTALIKKNIYIPHWVDKLKDKIRQEILIHVRKSAISFFFFTIMKLDIQHVVGQHQTQGSHSRKVTLKIFFFCMTVSLM
jgi:hypothetical protein